MLSPWICGPWRPILNTPAAELATHTLLLLCVLVCITGSASWISLQESNKQFANAFKHVCVFDHVWVCVLNDILRWMTMATQGGKWMGKSARLFMQPWQHNNETHSPCAPVQPVTSAPLAAQRPPLALRSHWEERHAGRESDGAVLLSVASPDSIHHLPPLLLEFIGCAQLWHSLKSTHYPDICTHHMQN